MLILSPPFELRRIEVQDWQRDGERETLCVTAHFACGCTRQRKAHIDYRSGERQRILEAVLGDGPADPAFVQRVEQLRASRWTLKQTLLGDMQRDYGHGLPRHDTHGDGA